MRCLLFLYASGTEAGSEAGSEGRFEKEGLAPGDYTLRVVTSDPETEREEELVGRFHVSSRMHSHSFCSVHLINCGARLERGTLTVEFAGTGLASKECAKFNCCLNEICQECEYITCCNDREHGYYWYLK